MKLSQAGVVSRAAHAAKFTMSMVVAFSAASFRPSDAQAQCAALSAGANVDISRRTGNEAEPAIAIDPTNTQRLFALSNVDSGSFMFGAYSTNGGTTWTTRNVATGSDGLAAACCDPALAWDNFGNLFICYITSSINAVIVGVSTNGGQSFTQIASFSGSIDQPSITTGVNTVWVCYNLSGSMVARGATVSGLGTVGAFTAALSVPSASGSFGDIAIGPSGQVMLTYQSPTGGQGPATIYCNTDPDGLGASPFGARVTVTSTNVGGFDFIPAQSSRSVDAEAGLAWDRTGGPHNGRVYLVYTDETVNENNDTEIYVRYSDNNGAAWSARVRVNDDTVGNLKSQFNPRIAMDQTTGVIALAWMDCRNSAGNNTAQNWGTISTDFGATFLSNIQISAGASNASTAGSSTDYGDYNGLACHGGVFYPIWADNSGALPGYVGSPRFDLGTARVAINLGPNAPTSPNASPSTICVGQSSTLTATVGAGETVDWFTGSCGGTAVPGGAAPSVTPSATTTYFARARNTTTGCTSAACASVTVTVNALPANPIKPDASPPAICLGSSSTLSATFGAGETVDWFTDACGVTPVPGGEVPTVTPSATTTYFARARNTTSGCTSAACASVTVLIADHTGDFDGGGVGLSDLPTFVSILLNPGTPFDCIADMNNDGVADGADIQLWIIAFIGP